MTHNKMANKQRQRTVFLVCPCTLGLEFFVPRFISANNFQNSQTSLPAIEKFLFLRFEKAIIQSKIKTQHTIIWGGIPVNIIDWDSDFFPALSLGLFFDPSTAIF